MPERRLYLDLPVLQYYVKQPTTQCIDLLMIIKSRSKHYAIGCFIHGVLRHLCIVPHKIIDWLWSQSLLRALVVSAGNLWACRQWLLVRSLVFSREEYCDATAVQD